MKQAPIFTLSWKDAGKGLFLAVIAAVLTGLETGIQTGHIDWKAIGTVAAIAGLSYLGKNFLSNSDGTPLAPEPNPNQYTGK